MGESNEMPEAKVRGAKHIFDLLYGVIAEQMNPIEAMRTAGRLVEGVSSIIRSICDANHARYERDFASNSTLERDELLRWQRWAAAQLGDDSPRTNQELRECLTANFRRRISTKVRELQKEVDARIRDMDTMRQDLARTHATLCRWRTWAGALLKLDDVGLWDEELRGRIVGLIEAGAAPRDVEHAKQVCDLIGARVAWSEWARKRLHVTEGIVEDTELRERLDAQKDVDEHKRIVDRLREDLAQTNSHLVTWQRWARSVLREGPLALSDVELRGRIATALWDRGYVSDAERAKQFDELAKQIVGWREWASDIIRDKSVLFADDDGWRKRLTVLIEQPTSTRTDELLKWQSWAKANAREDCWGSDDSLRGYIGNVLSEIRFPKGRA